MNERRGPRSNRPRDGVDIDDLATVLSNRYRRYVVSELASEDGRYGLDELAAAVAKAEADSRVGEATTALQRRIMARLHHCHLPKLAACGVLEYDIDSREVSITADGSEYAALLDLDRN